MSLYVLEAEYTESFLGLWLLPLQQHLVAALTFRARKITLRLVAGQTFTVGQSITAMTQAVLNDLRTPLAAQRDHPLIRAGLCTCSEHTAAGQYGCSSVRPVWHRFAAIDEDPDFPRSSCSGA